MPCKLTRMPNSGEDFAGKTGDKVTLVTADPTGVVLIGQATYAGTDLVPAATSVSTIDFTIAAGANPLNLVFNMPGDSAGNLREDAPPDSQLLLQVAGDDPAKSIVIHGS